MIQRIAVAGADQQVNLDSVAQDGRHGYQGVAIRPSPQGHAFSLRLVPPFGEERIISRYLNDRLIRRKQDPLDGDAKTPSIIKIRRHRAGQYGP